MTVNASMPSACQACGGPLGRRADDGVCAACLDRREAGLTPTHQLQEHAMSALTAICPDCDKPHAIRDGVFAKHWREKRPNDPRKSTPTVPCEGSGAIAPEVTEPPPPPPPPPAPAVPAQPELRTLQVAELVLDASLQCRAAIDDETVNSYAESMREGATFPPIRVVHVEGQLLVVDGWHRLHATKQAGLKTIAAQVRPGTRREALLSAIAANADHGKSRTIEDKRRAVRALLQDPEWCCLASRELAKLAGTSHTFINETRARYGVEPGEVLTELRVAEVDQGIPAAWAHHYLDSHGKPVSTWRAKELDAVRLAPTFAKAMNATKGPYGYSWNDNFPLLLQRVEELAARQVPSPPWPAEFEGEANCTQLLDEVDSLERLALHPSCPNYLRKEAVLAVHAAKLIPGLSQYEDNVIKRVEAAVKDRPKLEAALAARKAEWAKGREPSGADKVLAIKDPAAQAEALREFAAQPNFKISSGIVEQLAPEVRNTLGRELLDAQEETRTHACRWPGCGGWIAGKASWARCVVCRHTDDDLDRLIRDMEQAAYGLQFSEVEVISCAGAYIDGEWRGFKPVRLNGLAVRLLSTLAALPPSAFSVDVGPATDAFFQAYCDWHGALEAPPAQIRADLVARHAAKRAQAAERDLEADEDDAGGDDQADDDGEE